MIKGLIIVVLLAIGSNFLTKLEPGQEYQLKKKQRYSQVDVSKSKILNHGIS